MINKNLKIQIIVRFALAPIIFGLFFFLPAGTFKYWPGWIYIGVLIIPAIFTTFYFLKHDPELLNRRSKLREVEKEQKVLISFLSFYFIIFFLFPGFDFRFQWSDVPVWLVILSNFLVLLCYMMVMRVLRENSFAGRTVEVFEGQKVISSGPYSVVRHPMYTGVTLMFFLSPTALGSYWLLILAIPLPFLFVLRILSEEKVLLKDLEGYDDYCRKVKWRLIPYIW